MEAPQPDSPIRKLARSRDNRWIAGVSGGLAKYFNVDPVLFRILFVILAFTGAGIPLYLLAWLIIPAEGESESIGDSLVRRAREGRKS
jgi:phage shock protein PspC (stress-responsive transcriptional regulator)